MNNSLQLLRLLDEKCKNCEDCCIEGECKSLDQCEEKIPPVRLITFIAVICIFIILSIVFFLYLYIKHRIYEKKEKQQEEKKDEKYDEKHKNDCIVYGFEYNPHPPIQKARLDIVYNESFVSQIAPNAVLDENFAFQITPTKNQKILVHDYTCPSTSPEHITNNRQTTENIFSQPDQSMEACCNFNTFKDHETNSLASTRIDKFKEKDRRIPFKSSRSIPKRKGQKLLPKRWKTKCLPLVKGDQSIPNCDEDY
ncbi:unnamed protein product [Moneuplotes crassus]|uniref:Uncharacterized protein n=1 Tax=Euplotes crassus TaxID=5936 RepID=A0AAD2CY58_EUPCR|nr:unnamed protein product [Moneuplotes crassus]